MLTRSSAFLHKEFKRTKDNPSFSIGLVEGSIYTWEVIILGPSNTLYENGIFKAIMQFPENYPDSPPKFRFVSDMWHPNIDKDGNVCISILHEPGDDMYEYECVAERWMPVRNPESVILSIVALLNWPNSDSPANLDAAREFREDKILYDKKVLRLTQKTLE
ncbi:hypothetical protein VCUG_00942 [Vavraia culicis subsp. floridensis]|uniref:UBC core domain-containing protein n=1 Tax=Vavraia culicis (isolate floridensis) TaxID=948595 RepID=L2GVG2_VAVCU|nr:uncharacterized protein VCUG_00942 [Vavraia culicis subsp. floridensis]ELA47619.1 hypothetical protein VCUG_00942 [Vavraia culicis subsp. floridensis]